MVFWAKFWPGLVATVAGIILGLPVALWINSLSGRAAARARATEERQQLRHGLESVLTAIRHNVEQLEILLRILGEKKALFELKVDTAAWEASRDQVTPFLRRPILQRRIAFHFDRMKGMARLTVLYLDMSAGIAATIGGVEDTRAALLNHMTSHSAELISEARHIANDIDVVLADVPAA